MHKHRNNKAGPESRTRFHLRAQTLPRSNSGTQMRIGRTKEFRTLPWCR